MDMGETRLAIAQGVQESLAACWEGEAKDAFSLGLAAFCEELSAFIEEWRRLNASLGEAVTAYRRADDAAQGAAGGVKLQTAL
jgi:uncharacterized protein YukE